MKTYWDSSALIAALHTPPLRSRLHPGTDGTRIHSLAEIFSTLTKGVNFRYSPEDGARMIFDLACDLDLIELNAQDALSAISLAESLGVRGARIHDMMHAAAARKYAAESLMTLDTHGFVGLAAGLRVASP